MTSKQDIIDALSYYQREILRRKRQQMVNSLILQDQLKIKRDYLDTQIAIDDDLLSRWNVTLMFNGQSHTFIYPKFATKEDVPTVLECIDILLRRVSQPITEKLTQKEIEQFALEVGIDPNMFDLEEKEVQTAQTLFGEMFDILIGLY